MNLFQSISTRRPRLNKFDLTHERKMAIPMGKLIPILIQDIVPGDKFRVNTEILCRFAPMLAPIMHRVDITTHYFFVPNRLVWSEWEDFITGGPEGTSAPVSPYFRIATNATFPTWKPVNSFYKNTLSDYMGLPVPNADFEGGAVVDPQNISAIPFRAYQLIFNEYYRDQNLQDKIALAKTSGQITDAEAIAIMYMRDRCWEKDVFTSALPFAQRGPEATVPVTGDINPGDLITGDIREQGSGNLSTGDLAANIGVEEADGGIGGVPVYHEIIGSGTLDNAALNINDLRRSVKLQEWLEKNARGGARYIEQILSHFGVMSSDARLQRPEYLGGGKTRMRISEVLSTYQDPDDAGLPQANMAGHGIAVGNTNQFSKRFEEHGYVIGIMSVLPKTSYQQGLPRHFQRFDKFDYFWPEFANIGEQVVENREVFWDGVNTATDPIFGYQSRYHEYKFQPSTVHGNMRDQLAYWHMGRIFDNPPVLNSTFVIADPTTRIFPVTETQEQIYVQLVNKISALRPMPYFGTPQL